MAHPPDYCTFRNPPIEGDPFELARASCEEMLCEAGDVSIDDDRLQAYATELDAKAVREVAEGHMGENCDVGAGHFGDPVEAANFAVLFGLLQFGHGFRYELHELCDRGASKTITLGVTNLRQRGIQAKDLGDISLDDVRELFDLPADERVDEFSQQICAALQQAVEGLAATGDADFDAFCRRLLASDGAVTAPAATLVRELANSFPAFNDQWEAESGLRVVFLKKATLAVGELSRLTDDASSPYRNLSDLRNAIAPIDNVIPAVLTFHGVLKLSDELCDLIHNQRKPLPRGRREAELRAASLVACERMAAAVDGIYRPIDLGYYLWLAGKIPEIRQFARHHTQDTIYY